MTKPKQPRGLGRGLSSLMSDVPTSQGVSKVADAEISIDIISPNPDQPRRTFDEGALDDLARSISEKGIIQPLILRPDPSDSSRYQIVAGERRWRAAQLCKLHKVPAIVRDFDDIEVLEVAIIENIQRADLNAIDEAQGYHDLVERFGHTQDKLAQALGKSRSHIANTLRLLNLPSEVKDRVSRGALSAGHARALVGRENAVELAREIEVKGLSVRQVEKLVIRRQKPRATPKPPEKDADTRQLEADLTAQLGMKVTLTPNRRGEGGAVTLTYRDLEQLDDLLQLLNRN